MATHRLLMTTIPQFVAFMDKQFGPNPAKEQVASVVVEYLCVAWRSLPFLHFAQDSLLAADARLYDSLRDKMHESGARLSDRCVNELTKSSLLCSLRRHQHASPGPAALLRQDGASAARAAAGDGQTHAQEYGGRLHPSVLEAGC